jgi:hypothetical protein
MDHPSPYANEISTIEIMDLPINFISIIVFFDQGFQIWR